MRRVAALAAVLAAVPACAHAPPRDLEGDGNATTQRRDLPPFEGIALETSADVSVRVGGDRAVSVTVDGNLQPYIVTEVRRGALVIRADGQIRPRAKARVDVTVPVLTAFDLEGSGAVDIDGGSGPLTLAIEGSGGLRWKGEATKLLTAIQGSGEVRLDGRADRLEVAVTGSGDVHAERLVASDVSAAVDGSGDVDVSVHGGVLSAVVSGSGRIRWRGEARVERVVVTGSGSVEKKE